MIRSDGGGAGDWDNPVAAAPTNEKRPRGLKRSMRLAGALLLTLSAITPASSVFVIVPGVINQAGTGAILSMSFAVVIAISIAYVYAELSSAFPVAGGEYSMIGRAIGPGAGFAALGLTITGNTFATAVLALGTSDYLAVVTSGAQSARRRHRIDRLGDAARHPAHPHQCLDHRNFPACSNCWRSRCSPRSASSTSSVRCPSSSRIPSSCRAANCSRRRLP